MHLIDELEVVSIDREKSPLLCANCLLLKDYLNLVTVLSLTLLLFMVNVKDCSEKVKMIPDYTRFTFLELES
jgi:hypothetical protein